MPQVPIEDYIKSSCPAVANVMMVGDQKKYNTALICLTTEGATGEQPGTDQLAGPALALTNGRVQTVSAAVDDDEINKLLYKVLKATNENPTVCTNNASRIQKFKSAATPTSATPIPNSGDACSIAVAMSTAARCTN